MVFKLFAKLLSFTALILALLFLQGCGGGSGSKEAANANAASSSAFAVSSAMGSSSVAAPFGGAPSSSSSSSSNPSISLSGIDSNSNGVRDEVESYIVAQMKEPAAQEAALNYAQSIQSWLTLSNLSQQDAQGWIVEELDDYACLKNKAGADSARNLSREISIRTFDTAERIRAKQALLDAAGMFELPASRADKC